MYPAGKLEFERGAAGASGAKLQHECFSSEEEERV